MHYIVNESKCISSFSKTRPFHLGNFLYRHNHLTPTPTNYFMTHVHIPFHFQHMQVLSYQDQAMLYTTVVAFYGSVSQYLLEI